MTSPAASDPLLDDLAVPISFEARHGDGVDRAIVLGGGGLFFVAWQISYLHGLARREVDLGRAELVVGTSAGSIVASILTSGRLSRFATKVDLLSKAPFLVAALAGSGTLRPSQERARDAFAAATDGLFERDPHFVRLGREPLAPPLTGSELARLAQGGRGPVKGLLMDGSRLVGVGNEALQARVGKTGVPQHRGVHLAVEQHLHQLAPLGGSLDRGRILELRHVRLLERHPLDARDVHAVVLHQDAADPGAGGHRVRTHAYAFSMELFRGKRCVPLRIENQIGMLEARHDDERQKPVGLVERLGDEERHDRHFGDVELEVAHHALESGRDAALVLRELEAIGARAKLLRHRIVADQGLEQVSSSRPRRP